MTKGLSRNGSDPDALLSVRDLTVEVGSRPDTLTVVRGISFDIAHREVLALVGESGSGKTMSALAVAGMVTPPFGRVVTGTAWFEGRDLLSCTTEELREVRGARIGIVFQEPSTAMNPVLTIGRQLVDQMRAHGDVSNKQARRAALGLLDRVGIAGGDRRLRLYPHELSGGMQQRAIIAMALSCNPVLLIADEPTTALDVTIQAQILELILGLKDELRMSVLLISHDLAVVADMADRVAVMYDGTLLEIGPCLSVFSNPRHPYTRELLESCLRVDLDVQLLGMPVRAEVETTEASWPGGCVFYRRCNHSMKNPRCFDEEPALRLVGPEHVVATFCDV